MDVLTKAIYKKGIAFSHPFHYVVDENNFTLSVGDILEQINAGEGKADYSSSLNYIKRSPKNVALSFLEGIGLKMVHNQTLGKDAKRISLILQMLAYTDKGVPLQVVNEIGEVEDWILDRGRGNDYLLGRYGENLARYDHKGVTMALAALIKRIVGLPGDDDHSDEEETG